MGRDRHDQHGKVCDADHDPFHLENGRWLLTGCWLVATSKLTCQKSYPIQTAKRGLRKLELPPCVANSTSSQSLLNRVRHAQSKWMGKPSAKVSRPMPYEARPSFRRKPLMLPAGPYVSTGRPARSALGGP